MPRKTTLPYVKTVRSKGRVYEYFDTGRRNANGAKVYAKLPPKDSPGFGAAYAAMVGHRNRKEPDGSITVSALIDLFEKSPKFLKYSNGTKRVYRIYLDEFRDLFGPAPAGLLERRDIILVIDKRATTPGAANMLLAVINALYKWGRSRTHVANDPGKDITQFDTGEHEPWDIGLLEAALACDDARVRLPVHMLYYTAQRIGDVCKIRWGDVRDGVVTVTQQKTGKELLIPLHSALKAELARHGKHLGTIVQFKQQTIRDDLQRFASALGHDIVPHGLRKNAVNALLEAGCSVPEAAAISGQTMQLVEYYARKRNQAALGSAAMLKWDRPNKQG